MVKAIEIEYCSTEGLGAPAARLKKAILAEFPDATVETRAVNGTGKIEVSWKDDNNKRTVWSKGKIDTENGHPSIIANLKESQ